MDHDDIIDKLNECHNGAYKKGVIIGNKIFEQIINKEIVLIPRQLSRFLDAYYVNAFYHDKNLAIRIGQYYIDKALEDSSFYESYIANKNHIDQNLSYCNLSIPAVNNKRRYPLTLVTALFNLSNKEPNSNRRSFDDYLESGKYTLSIDCPLIIYIEPEYVDYIIDKRKSYGLENKTLVIPIKFDDLEFYREAEKIKMCRQINPIINANSVKDTYLYMIVIWSKFTLLKRTIENNPFDSSHISWIDFGITHVAKVHHVKQDNIFPLTYSQCWLPNKIKMQMMMIWDTNIISNWRLYFSYIRGHICGGYFSGSMQNMLELCKIFILTANECLNSGFGPSEEQILPIIIHKNAQLFDMYYGDYPDILNNYRYQRGSITLNITNIKKCLELGNYDVASDIWNKLYTNFRKGECNIPNEFLDLVGKITIPDHEISQIKMSESCPIAIGIITNKTNSKYIMACANTWCKTAKEYGIPVYFFGGYMPYVDNNIDYINITSGQKIDWEACPNTKEDIVSNWDKYFFGLKYLYFNTTAKYYMMIECDTYINIPNLMNCLREYNPYDHVYLGGLKGPLTCKLDNEDIICLGDGFVYSNRTVQDIIDIFNETIINWESICIRNKRKDLFKDYNTTIAYYMNKLGIYFTQNDKFNPYKLDDKNMDELISCHCMEPKDMEEYDMM